MNFFRSRPVPLAELLANGAWDEALERIDEDLRRRPDSFELLRARAETLLRAERRTEALVVFRSLVDSQTEQGFYARALALIATIERIAPGHGVLIAQLSERISARQRRVARPSGSPAQAAAGASPARPTDSRTASGAFFMSFSPAVLPDILTLTEVRTFARGEAVLREGDSGRSLFLIEEGSVEVRMTPATGVTIRLALLRPGQFFGEVAALSDRPRTATVVAQEDLLVLELTREKLDRLEAKHPSVRAVIERVRGERALATIAALRART